MLDLTEPIFCIKALDDGSVGIIDQASTYRRVDPVKFKTLAGFKSKLHHQQKIFNLVDVSSSGDYVVLSIPKREKAALYFSETKKLVATIGKHQGEIEAVAFSSADQYVATGGTDGKSYVYFAQSGALLFALPPHRDYVSSIAFSPNNHYVATGSFDQTIQVKNIASMGEPFRLIGHTSVIKKVLFVSNDELLSADREGNIILWGVKSKAIKKRFTKMPDEINDMAISEDKRFLFIASKRAYIALYDLKTGKQLSARYVLDSAAINSIAVAQGLLCYGNDAGEFQTFSLDQDEARLKIAISDGNYLNAYTLINLNPILRYSTSYKQLEQEWQDAYVQARDALIEGKRDEAQWLLTPFSRISDKQSAIKTLMEDFVEFGKFKEFIASKKYSLAYGLVSKYPSYKETKEYAKLEKIWELSFEKAKTSLIEADDEERAKKYLVNFRAIPSKSKMINELFEQRKAFLLFRKRLTQRDFETIFKLVKNYPFLMQYQEYKDMMHWGDQNFIKVQQLLDMGDYIEAAKVARQIKSFPEFKNDIATLTQEPQVYIEFDQALKSGSAKRVYNIIDQHPYLADLQAAITFEKPWLTVEQEALKLASLGDLSGMFTTFSPFWDIPYKRKMIATILQSGMISKISKLMQEGIEHGRLNRLLELFVNHFGSDLSLRIIVNDYSFEKGESFDCDAFMHGSTDTINLEQFKKEYELWT